MGLKNIFIFFGPPGSGKGSLSYLCVKELGWLQFSTGNVCRQHIAQKTDIGAQIDFAIKSGKLISDDLVIAMVENWLVNNLSQSNGIILDGFPRTVVQAMALNQLLAKPLFDGISFHVIRMVIPDQIIIDRLSSRSICQNNECQRVYSLSHNSPLRPKCEMTCNECGCSLIRRVDDEEVSVRERLAIYQKHELELMNYYDSCNQKITQLDVTVPLDEVYQRLVNSIGFKIS